jgi:hypothetical protein
VIREVHGQLQSALCAQAKSGARMGYLHPFRYTGWTPAAQNALYMQGERDANGWDIEEDAEGVRMEDEKMAVDAAPSEVLVGNKHLR